MDHQEMDHQEIGIKRVTTEDYERVMAILPPDEIYHGGDYLPDYFHMLLEMPNIEMYAAVAGDKFVGFSFMSIVDDGKTVVPRGGRVSKEYSGKGLVGLMSKWLDEGGPLYRQGFLYRAAIGNKENAPLLQHARKGLCKEILQQDFRFYDIWKFNLEDEFKKQRESNQFVNARFIEKDEFGQILESRDLSRYFFPEGRAVVDDVPYKTMRSNAPLIFTERTKVVVTDTNNPHEAILSISNFFKAPVGMIVNLNIYGCLSEKIKSHLILHVEKLLPCLRSDFILFRCISKPDTNWANLDNVMTELGFKTTHFYGTGLVCVEWNLKSKL
ncbi:histidine N-acetyltransferase-like [Mytilus californianus]|uniref:histidine N-acetyltransferase-like n=1 Tax=Mytilus californianus TaxID=6549 RepID=UPI0022467F69|nr:histidine N-acetyltransferase-like [Mytilus californianus]